MRINPLDRRLIEVARWDNEQDGKCPACIQEGAENPEMVRASIGDVPVHVCEHHHICMPIKE